MRGMLGEKGKPVNFVLVEMDGSSKERKERKEKDRRGSCTSLRSLRLKEIKIKNRKEHACLNLNLPPRIL
jgi:hypothetical protein